MDFAPTLVDAAGISLPGQMDGRSFFPLINRKVSSLQDDVFIQISESQVGRAVRTKRWKYSIRAGSRCDLS